MVFFPRHDPSFYPFFVGPLATGVGYEERFTDAELAGIAKSFSIDKAPGLDRNPNLSSKVVITDAPEMFKNAMQKSLDEEAFSKCAVQRAYAGPQGWPQWSNF